MHGGRVALLLVGASPDAYARFERDERSLLLAATTLAAALSQPLHMRLLRRHGRLSAAATAAAAAGGGRADALRLGAARLGFMGAATMLAHAQLVPRVLSLVVPRPAPEPAPAP